MKLFRPVGIKELEKILLANAKAFPPRLAWQPIFYPVLNFEYASQIATEWNVNDAFSGYCGFVTEFEIEDSFASKYEVQNVGGEAHNELWVPSEDLADFNANIIGNIQIAEAYYGERYEGKIENTVLFKDLTAKEQLDKIKLLADSDLKMILLQETIAVEINFKFWRDILKEKETANKISNSLP